MLRGLLEDLARTVAGIFLQTQSAAQLVYMGVCPLQGVIGIRGSGCSPLQISDHGHVACPFGRHANLCPKATVGQQMVGWPSNPAGVSMITLLLQCKAVCYEDTRRGATLSFRCM